MEIAAATQALLAAAMPPTAAAPATPAAPSALVTERFNAMMNAPDATQAMQTDTQSTLQQAFAAQPSDQSQGSLGSQILAGLQSSAAQVSQQWQTLAGCIDRVATRPSVGDLLQVQAQIVQAEVQYDLVSKTVSKATSNIDTLVRMS